MEKPFNRAYLHAVKEARRECQVRLCHLPDLKCYTDLQDSCNQSSAHQMLLSGGANVHNVTMNREQLNVNTHFMDMQKICVKTESEIQNFNFNIDCSVFVSLNHYDFLYYVCQSIFCLSIFRQIRIIYLQCSDVILDCKHPVSITHLYHVFNKRHLKDQCKIFDFFFFNQHQYLAPITSTVRK